MSDTAGNTNNPDEDDDGGLFCQSCSPVVRKIGYYLTFIVGAILFIIGFISIFLGSLGLVIAGTILILFCPFWIKSLKKCFLDFRDLIKLTSFLIYVIFFILVILTKALGWSSILQYILGIGLGLSGIWYFLTFIPNGQKACIACLKACCTCCSKSESSS